MVTSLILRGVDLLDVGKSKHHFAAISGHVIFLAGVSFQVNRLQSWQPAKLPVKRLQIGYTVVARLKFQSP